MGTTPDPTSAAESETSVGWVAAQLCAAAMAAGPVVGIGAACRRACAPRRRREAAGVDGCRGERRAELGVGDEHGAEFDRLVEPTRVAR